jgi:hypothetical protein
MDTQGKLHAGAEALESVTDHARQRAGQMAETAKYGARRAGNEVSSFVHRRPVETALLSAAAACLITGLAFWFSRPD